MRPIETKVKETEETFQDNQAFQKQDWILFAQINQPIEAIFQLNPSDQ